MSYPCPNTSTDFDQEDSPLQTIQSESPDPATITISLQRLPREDVTSVGLRSLPRQDVRAVLRLCMDELPIVVVMMKDGKLHDLCERV